MTNDAGRSLSHGRERPTRRRTEEPVKNVMSGFMPVSLTIVGTAWGLVELVVAGAVGAYLYRDEWSTESVRRADLSGMPRR
jgi:hypothetical protein